MRILLGGLCVLCTVVFLVLAWAFVQESFGSAGALMTSWWVSGIAALLFGVAACRIEQDSTDNADYLGSIVHGLRDEWRRP